MRNRRGVRKTESMKVTSLTGKAVITTELPKRSNSNGHVRPENGPRNEKLPSNSSVDGATYLPSTSEVAKNDDKKFSESLGASNEPIASVEKKANVSDGLPDDRPKNLHMRSASLPANVRATYSKEAKGASSPKTDKKATRNKSFAGVTKTSMAKKAPLEIFSLPETDVDSGISVACERPSTGRASKRNLRILDLMKNTDVKEEGKKEKPNKRKPKDERLRVKLPSEKTSGKRSPNLARPDIRVPPNAPYAPNYLETDLDDERGKRGNYLVDMQRSFHVFIPNARSKMDTSKRLTYFAGCSASDEKLLRDRNTREKRLGLFARFKDGAYFCYCADVLRIRRYSGFLWVVPTNTGIFLCGLKLFRESRTQQVLLVSKMNFGGNHAFFRDNKASIW